MARLRVKMYRIAKPGETAVLHPDSQTYVVPDHRIAYRGDDPLVINFPHLFISDEDTVEAATAEPGEKRNINTAPVYEGNI